MAISPAHGTPRFGAVRSSPAENKCKAKKMQLKMKEADVARAWSAKDSSTVWYYKQTENARRKERGEGKKEEEEGEEEGGTSRLLSQMLQKERKGERTQAHPGRTGVVMVSVKEEEEEEDEQRRRRVRESYLYVTYAQIGPLPPCSRGTGQQSFRPCT